MGDDIFLNKINDIVRLSSKYHEPKFSKFLDEAQVAQVEASWEITGTLFGGYDAAERKVFGVFPDWCEPDPCEFPITVLHIIKKYEKELTHRHYLGTILSLGIERNKIGDILVTSDGAYVFLISDIAEFVKDNIDKIAGCGVDIKILDANNVKVPEKKYELCDIVAASERLDAVIASLLKISRNDAKALILSGKVSVNHFETDNISLQLAEGNLLSVRGFGRAEIFAFGNKTRSDRTHITIKKFI